MAEWGATTWEWDSCMLTLSAVSHLFHDVFSAFIKSNNSIRTCTCLCVPGPITCVCFSQDGQCTLSSSLDSTVRLLDKSTGEMLGEWVLFIYSVLCLHNGFILLVSKCQKKSSCVSKFLFHSGIKDTRWRAISWTAACPVKTPTSWAAQRTDTFTAGTWWK